MSLRCAIMTALMERPSNGRELTHRFDRSIGYFWDATHQQIYRELGRMADEGLIRLTASQEKGRGAPRTYEITEAGKQCLRRWVLEGQEPVPVRDPLLVRLRAAAALGGIDMSEQLRQHVDCHRSLLETYRRIEDRDFDRPLKTRRERLQYLILQAGIETEQAWASWSAKAAEQLSELRKCDRRSR